MRVNGVLTERCTRAQKDDHAALCAARDTHTAFSILLLCSFSTHAHNQRSVAPFFFFSSSSCFFDLQHTTL